MKILIPFDGSKFAEDVLEPVMRLVDRNDKIVALHLLRVVKKSEARTIWNEIPGSATEAASIWTYGGVYSYDTSVVPMTPVPRTAVETNDQALDRLYSEATDYLNQVADRLFPYVTEKTVVFGESPAEEIIKYARREKIDLIAIATHGRTGLARLLFGSVAAKLAKAGVAMLLTVHPDDKPVSISESGVPAAVETDVHSDAVGRAA